MIANLTDRTGKSYEQWATIVAGTGETKHGAIVKALKSHGVGHGYADAVARKYRNGDGGDDIDLVAQLYSGRKEGLRPIHDRLIEMCADIANDIEVSPKKTYVSLRTGKQFALIQPSTATRVDLGLRLPGVTATERLEGSGSFNNTVSHRVRLTDPAEVDDELRGWLEDAYKRA